MNLGIRRWRCAVWALAASLLAAPAGAENLLALEPATNKPVEVVTLASDANASQFLIFIHTGVPAHKHITHSESIYVLSGEGQMRLGDRQFAIGAGDFVQVPMGVAHGVSVSSPEPLKVLSIQAPEFHGADRVWVKDPAP
jgi:mannose-6-phosphate isomerase-like protein (cupin superfamily)